MMKLVRTDWKVPYQVFETTEEVENYYKKLREMIFEALDENGKRDESFKVLMNEQNFTGFTIHCHYCYIVIDMNFIEETLIIYDKHKNIRLKYYTDIDHDFDCELYMRLLKWFEDRQLPYNDTFLPSSFKGILDKILKVKNVSIDGVDAVDCCILGHYDFLDIKEYPVFINSTDNCKICYEIMSEIQKRLYNLLNNQRPFLFKKLFKNDECVVFKVDVNNMTFMVEIPLERGKLMRIDFRYGIVATAPYDGILKMSGTESLVDKLLSL